MVRMREENGVAFKTYERGYPVGFKAATEARYISWPCSCHQLKRPIEGLSNAFIFIS